MQAASFWFLEKDTDDNHEFGNALMEDATLGILNTRELLLAEHRLRSSTGTVDSPWPTAYPLPVAALPERSFAPDFWSFGGYEFASGRLREAFAQPADVLQFMPFDLIRASAEARAQDYRWMRVLASQEALDLSRCDCEIEEVPHVVTGAPLRFLENIEQFVVREDLLPRTEIFRVQEYPTFFLVTDRLAARVLHAGCTGIEFSDPSNRWGGMRIDRYRTADGVGERRVGFLD